MATTTHSSSTPQTKVFEHRSTFSGATVEQLWQFHEQPSALSILTPPPIFMQVHRNGRTSLTAGEVDFTLWMAFIPVRWTARHEPGSTPTSFIDRMLRGPLAVWQHEHIMSEAPGGATLTDRITLAHKPGLAGLFTRLVFDGLPLRVLFVYRHLRTRLALRRGRR